MSALRGPRIDYVKLIGAEVLARDKEKVREGEGLIPV